MHKSFLLPIRFIALLFFCLSTVASMRADSPLQIAPAVSQLTVFRGGTATLYVTATAADPTADITVTMKGLPQGIQALPIKVKSGVATPLIINVSQSAGPYSGYNFSTSIVQTASVVAYSNGASASANVVVTLSISNNAYLPPSGTTDLPIVRIDTGGVAINSTDINVPGTITISSGDGSKAFLPGVAGTDNTATFHLHGNSTAYMQKSPYKVKLNTSTDLLGNMGLQCPYVNSSNAMICDKSKSYILLANFLDKTMLHDWAAFSLSMNMPIGNGFMTPATGSPTPTNNSTLAYWAPHSLFVDVYVNGEYEGVYQLVESITVDTHRVNITEMDQTDVSGKSLTGGYLMEWDARADATTTFTVPHGGTIDLDDPDFDPVVPEQKNYIVNYMATVDSTLFSSTYQNPTTGWRSYMDEATLTNFYIVNDLLQNWDSDVLYASAFMYKNKNSNLLYMGPVWDFDLAAGHNSTQAVGPWDPRAPIGSQWFKRLFSDPTYVADVSTQWKKLRSSGYIDNWLASITTQQAALEAAVSRDEQRWPYMGVAYGLPYDSFSSYDASVAEFMVWLKARIAYFDSLYGYGGATATTTTLTLPSMSYGTSAAYTASVSPSAATGTVIFTQDTMVLGQANLVNGVATLSASPRIQANSTFQAFYVGDSTYSPSQGTATGTVAAGRAPSITLLQRANGGLQVTVLANSGGVIATGTATLQLNGATVSQATLDGTGKATFTLPTASNIQSLIAIYSGDTTYLPSTSSMLDVAQNAASTTSLLATRSTDGTNDLLVATIQSSSTPITAGVVQFCSDPDCIGEHVLGSVAVTQSGTASLTVRPLHATSYVAVYTGTQSFISSTSNQVSFTPFTTTQHTTIATLAQTATTVSGPTLQTTVTGDGTNLSPTGTVALQDTDNGNYALGSGALSASTATLVPHATVQAAASASSLLTADLNGDGLADLVVADPTTGGIDVLLQTSTGSFQAPVAYATGYGASSAVSGDFNRDGIPDLAVANPASSTVSILLGTGNGVFAPATSFTTYAPANQLAVADVYRDGALDLIASNTGANQITVYHGMFDGTFGQGISFNAGVGPAKLLTSDLNNDGFADVVVLNSDVASSGISVLLNQKDGTFATPVSYLTGLVPVAFVTTQTSGQTVPGLAVAQSNGTIALLSNGGAGSFTAASTLTTGTSPVALLRADLDGDGVTDLATVRVDGSVALLVGNGQGGYAAAQTFTGTAGAVAAHSGFFSAGSNTKSIAIATAIGAVSLFGLETPSLSTLTSVAIVGTGTHKVVAIYPGDGNFLGTQSATFAATAQPVTPTLSLAATTPTVVNSSITLTAQETHPDAQGHSTDGLTVTFSYQDSSGTTTVLGTGTMQGGTASIVGNDFTPGNITLIATMSGNDYFSASSAQTAQIISLRTLTLSTTDVSATYANDSVLLTATETFTSRRVPNGMMQFQIDSGDMVQATCTGTASPVTCTATYPLQGITAGQHQVNASTTATLSYAASSATSNLTVGKATASVTLTGLVATYDGSAHAVSTVTVPTGLAATFTYDGGSTVPVNAGSYTVVATIQDSNYVGTATGTLVIAKAAPTLSLPVAAHTYGDAPFALALTSNSGGAVTYSVLSGPATVSGSTLTLTAAGTVTVQASQATTANYLAATTQSNVTVSKAASSVSFTASSLNVTPLQSVTFVATVKSALTPVPTGSVTFMDNGTTLQTVALAAGQASYATTLSAGVTHSISTVYSGDANFNTSTSSSGAVSVVVAPLEFTFAGADATGTIVSMSNGIGTVHLNVIPQYGSFPGVVTFSASGLPTGYTATFQPASLPANSTGATVLVTIQSSTSSSLARSSSLVLALLPFGLLGFAGIRRRARALVLPMMLLVSAALVLGLQGCGTSSNIPAAQSYDFTITAASAGISHSQALTLKVLNTH